MGSNCNLEYQAEGGERRFLAAFSDIEDICYESELMSRGRVIMVVRTAAMVTMICGVHQENALEKTMFVL